MATELTGHDPGELIRADIEANGMGSHTSYGTGKPDPEKPLTTREQAKRISVRFASLSDDLEFLVRYIQTVDTWVTLLAEDIVAMEARRAE